MKDLIRSDDPNQHQTFLDEISKHRERLYQRVYGRTYIHWCAMYDRSSICERLIKMDGSIIDVRDRYNRTALMFASMQGSTSCMRVLLRHDANISAVDDDGDNALRYAVDNQRKDVERLLRDAMKNEPFMCTESSPHAQRSTCVETVPNQTVPQNKKQKFAF